MMHQHTRGIVYVAYGHQARDQCVIAARNLRYVHRDWPITVISDAPLTGADVPPTAWIRYPDQDEGARRAKLNVDRLSPYEWTCYMDTDTRARYSMEAGWQLLNAGWEMLIAPTGGQAETLFRHIPEQEKAQTIAELGGRPILALQGGVIWFRKCEAVHALYRTWREEWERWQDQDQAALVRALRRSPVKLLLLSRDWNGGCLLGHYHAASRRTGLKGAYN